jgi:hypothetical protein
MGCRALVFLCLSAFAGACLLTTSLDGLNGPAVPGGADGRSDAFGDSRDAGLSPDGPTSGDGAIEGSAPASYRTVVLSDGPVGYWRLGDRGPVAKDETGQHDGVYEGEVGQGAPGAIAGDLDTAATFGKGTVRIGDLFDFADLASFTIEAWLLYDHDPAEAGTEQYLVEKLNGYGGGYHLYLYTKGQLFSFDRCGDAGCDSVGVPFALPSPYRHIALAFNGATLLCNFYIDGKFVAGRPCTSPITDTSGNLRFGADDRNGGALWGTLDEVALYDKELSADRILAHYEAGVGR